MSGHEYEFGKSKPLCLGVVGVRGEAIAAASPSGRSRGRGGGGGGGGAEVIKTGRPSRTHRLNLDDQLSRLIRHPLAVSCETTSRKLLS